MTDPTARLAEIEADPKFADAEDWRDQTDKKYLAKALNLGLFLRQKSALDWVFTRLVEAIAIARGLQAEAADWKERNRNDKLLMEGMMAGADSLRKGLQEQQERAERAEADLKTYQGWREDEIALKEQFRKERDAARAELADTLHLALWAALASGDGKGGVSETGVAPGKMGGQVPSPSPEKPVARLPEPEDWGKGQRPQDAKPPAPCPVGCVIEDYNEYDKVCKTHRVKFFNWMGCPYCPSCKGGA